MSEIEFVCYAAFFKLQRTAVCASTTKHSFWNQTSSVSVSAMSWVPQKPIKGKKPPKIHANFWRKPRKTITKSRSSGEFFWVVSFYRLFRLPNVMMTCIVILKRIFCFMPFERTVVRNKLLWCPDGSVQTQCGEILSQEICDRWWLEVIIAHAPHQCLCRFLFCIQASSQKQVFFFCTKRANCLIQVASIRTKPIYSNCVSSTDDAPNFLEISQFFWLCKYLLYCTFPVLRPLACGRQARCLGWTCINCLAARNLILNFPSFCMSRIPQRGAL